MLSDPLHKLMRVSHDLWDQVMLIVILEVVDLLQILVVLLRHILNISQKVLILEVHPPIQPIVVFLREVRRRLLLRLRLRIVLVAAGMSLIVDQKQFLLVLLVEDHLLRRGAHGTCC